MKRLFCFVICVLMMVLFAAGCGSKSVDSSKILLDLEKLDFSEHAFWSSFVNDSQYSYTPEKVIKRQTNWGNKEDIVFYEVIGRNDYFKVHYSVKLVYNYYDAGGWILDEHYIERTNVVPIAFPETALIVACLEGNSFKYVDETKPDYSQNDNLINFCKSDVDIKWNDLDTENGIANFNITANVDDIASVTGNMNIYFDKDCGWTFFEEATDSVFNIENKSFNYDARCLGKFKWHYKTARGSVVDMEYQIVNVNLTTEEIETDEGNIEFDPLTVNGFMTYSDDRLYMCFSTEDNTWNFGEQKYIKIE